MTITEQQEDKQALVKAWQEQMLVLQRHLGRSRKNLWVDAISGADSSHPMKSPPPKPVQLKVDGKRWWWHEDVEQATHLSQAQTHPVWAARFFFGAGRAGSSTRSGRR